MRLFPEFKHDDDRFHWKDFWKSETEPLDEDGHGTSMLSTIMNIAPFADIVVARIAGVDDDLLRETAVTQRNLAKAIEWAVICHEVDIISMSLGWEKSSDIISDAILGVLKKRSRRLLFFAAASNFGAGTQELFPAKEKQVISVRATCVSGRHLEINPALSDLDNTTVVGTLGDQVPAAQRGGTHIDQVLTGTSIATAIAASIAAIVIGYINANDHRGIWEELRTLVGFERLMLRDGLSTLVSARKRFLTLEKFLGPEGVARFEACLMNGATA
ncbi:subtilisin-like protein [Pyrenochaeta sp. DS3sAY3a]|nr:subtilisin-like protein [Pyrenochaeta sp. DS3sAY3a]